MMQTRWRWLFIAVAIMIVILLLPLVYETIQEFVIGFQKGFDRAYYGGR